MTMDETTTHIKEPPKKLDIAIVSTSINEAPVAYAKWAKLGRLIIAGDKNTPPTLEHYIKSLGEQHQYIPPAQQDRWESSEVIGWHNIQRRNIAILEAIKSDVDYIITVDDDNIPLQNIDLILSAFENSHALHVSSALGWYDPCRELIPAVWHRGFPYSFRNQQGKQGVESLERYDVIKVPIGVVAATWLGEPDVGAIDRITNHVLVQGHHATLLDPGVVLQPGTWCPFNSQATAWRAEYASLMMCWPGVGRFDDIFASFAARRVLDELGVGVKYVQPLVRQDRNEHDSFVDLENEMFGYKHQDELCELLRAVDLRGIDDVQDMQHHVYDALSGARFLPHRTIESFECWMNDVKTAEKERAV